MHILAFSRRIILVKIYVNERGYRVHESHQNTILSRHEVELIRQLHEQGMRYAVIAEKFGISISNVGKICRFERRAATVWREINIHGEKVNS